MINETSFNDILHDNEFGQNSITVDNSKEIYFNNPVDTNSTHEKPKIDKEAYVNNDLDISDDTSDHYASSNSIELGKTAKKSVVHKIELTFLNKDDPKSDALNENKGMLNKEDLEILDVESIEGEENKIKDLRNVKLPNNQINEDHNGNTLLMKSDSSNLDNNKTNVESTEEKNTNLMITKTDADMNNLNTTTVINNKTHGNLNADINSHLHSPETKDAMKTPEIMDDITTPEVNYCANNLETKSDEKFLKTNTDIQTKDENKDRMMQTTETKVSVDTPETNADKQIQEKNYELLPQETCADKQILEKNEKLEPPETYHDKQTQETHITESNSGIQSETNDMPTQDTDHSINNTALKLDFTSLNSELYIPTLKKAPDCGPPPVYDTPAILNTQFNFNLK